MLQDMNDAPDRHTHALSLFSLFLCLVLFNFLFEAAAILLTEKVQELGLCFGGPNFLAQPSKLSLSLSLSVLKKNDG